MMDTAVTLRRNVSGAKDIDIQASFQIKITDLNNRQLTIKQRGDEYFHWGTSLVRFTFAATGRGR